MLVARLVDLSRWFGSRVCLVDLSRGFVSWNQKEAFLLYSRYSFSWTHILSAFLYWLELRLTTSAASRAVMFCIPLEIGNSRIEHVVRSVFANEAFKVFHPKNSILRADTAENEPNVAKVWIQNLSKPHWATRAPSRYLAGTARQWSVTPVNVGSAKRYSKLQCIKSSSVVFLKKKRGTRALIIVGIFSRFFPFGGPFSIGSKPIFES